MSIILMHKKKPLQNVKAYVLFKKTFIDLKQVV